MKTQAEALEALKCLSDMQRRTLLLLANGVPGKKVAERLGLTLWTVNIHRQMAYRKLGIKKAAQASVICTMAGLITDWNTAA